jgi:putative transposase
MRSISAQSPQHAYRIQFKPTPYFQDLGVCAKNLYNAATYLVRQTFFKKGKWLQYNSLYHQLKAEPVYLALKTLTDSYIPQQVLRQVEQMWRSFFNAMKTWEKTPEKFQSRPRPPKYQAKNRMYLITFPRRRVRVRGNSILFPKNMHQRGFPELALSNFPFSPQTALSARLVPFYDRFVLELIYEIEEAPLPCLTSSSQALGVDLGVNNLVTTSDGLLIKGGIVKSINQWFNKQLAKYQAFARHNNHLLSTSRVLSLRRHRANKLTDFFHKSSRALIKYCQANQIDLLVVGYNSGWKQHCRIGKRNTQNFVQIPFLKLVHMLEYKAKRVGIQVIRISEIYTSQQCSKCGFRRKSNRKSRGLYICAQCGTRFNADLNAARNILQKFTRSSYSSQVVPRECMSVWTVLSPDSGCVAHPGPSFSG